MEQLHSKYERNNKRQFVKVRDDSKIGGAYKKRPIQEVKDDPDTGNDSTYLFEVLLPNGTTVRLTLLNPDYEMSIKEFVGLVRDEYVRAKQLLRSLSQKRPVQWWSNEIYLEDKNDNRLRGSINFRNFKPLKKEILWLHDGLAHADTFENMWDITPDTDLLMDLPEEYNFETALADLIDNSLQAVWANPKNAKKLICVDIADDKISIFDTGPGMDGSDENCIVKWGKMGASLHRSSKNQAIGGKPPYLKPFFGLFGCGGSTASMYLGRRALVSSKTVNSKKVYELHLEREALLNSSSSLTWKTKGGIRNPFEDEITRSPQGSFTKIEIFEPRKKNINAFELQCRLKDIYFPYIQCDEVFRSGNTYRPIEFQVNGVDLAEIEGGEFAVTNLHSCNGPEFIVQVHFSLSQEAIATRSPGSTAANEANAPLKCIYFPISEGKENIERILEKLEVEGCGVAENYETFSRVSIRRLGRLLPDARWARLPFMDPKPQRGYKAHILKRCCSRAKCFIETDAGFYPTPSKTDLAQHNSFTTALKNLGKFSNGEKEVQVEIYREGKLLNPLQLEKDYHKWILEMHRQYDEEIESGEDQPVFVINPSNKKALGISSDAHVVRVHQVMKRKGNSWERGQKIKILKGAYAGFHKNHVYCTLEYFLVEGLQGDAGDEARIICRPLSVPEEDGCKLSNIDENICLDIQKTQSLPISVIDSEKLVPVEESQWESQLEKRRQKLHSRIDLPEPKCCKESKIDGLLKGSAIIEHSVQINPTVASAMGNDNLQICENDNVMMSLDLSTPKNAENLLPTINLKGLEGEIHEMGLRIGNYEAILKILDNKKDDIKKFMMDSQVEPSALELDCLFLKEEVMERIESREQSAASILCKLSRNFSSAENTGTFMDEVIGIVALLGTVSTTQLSRILAKYLGEDQMLAVVCRSYEAACCLEKCKSNGEIDHSFALHAEAAELGVSIDGQFLVVCLGNIMPYKGEFCGHGSERKLKLPQPVLPNGKVPRGFLGYAVNMIDIENDRLDMRAGIRGGLRATLFYRLFGQLQVYDTRENMKEALVSKKHGAVSLDGGMHRGNGLVSLGHWEPEIFFPVVPKAQSCGSPRSAENKRLIEEKKKELRSTLRSIEKVKRDYEGCSQRFKEIAAKLEELYSIAAVKEPFKDSA